MAPPSRWKPTACALLSASMLALLAVHCSAPPPAASPSPQGPAPTTAETSPSDWVVPAVPLVERRSVVLLQPRQGAPDVSALQPIAPDPAPLRERRQWVYDLRYDKGDLYLVGVHATELPESRQTPRVMGRFALELYTGPTLLERVRFDFPGLGADDHGIPDGGRVPLHGAGVSFSAKLTTRIGVMLPATERGTKLVLWDRATDRRWPLPWPAVEMVTEPALSVDAGLASE